VLDLPLKEIVIVQTLLQPMAKYQFVIILQTDFVHSYKEAQTVQMHAHRLYA